MNDPRLQGLEQSGPRHAAWPLSPAQEHKYDALAAFDAGHLQEAQHAFDLSVWEDLRNDRGMLAPSKPMSSDALGQQCTHLHIQAGVLYGDEACHLCTQEPVSAPCCDAAAQHCTVL